MHIVLGALGLIITILVLVNRLSQAGIDIGWLNPFAWKRRREWAKKYHANPLYGIKSPMDATALLMVAIAKGDGDMSANQKNEIKGKFREVFHLGESDAAALITSSNFLLKENLDAVRNVRKILEPSIDSFTEEQALSAIELVTHIANFDSPANTFQLEVVAALKSCFKEKLKLAGEWA